MTCSVSVWKSDSVVTSESNGRRRWQCIFLWFFLLGYVFLIVFSFCLFYLKVYNSQYFCAHRNEHESIVMTHGLVCLEVHLQHGTWSIFSIFYTKDIILHFAHQIALFCALVVVDFAVMVSLLAFLL